MPFKIIETLEKGQKKLCIIPSSWESKGILRWPRKRLDLNKLVRNENSIPLNNWSTSKCNVKRILSSYEEAARELDIMVQNSDTEIDNVTESNLTTINNTNFNALAGQLALTQSEEPSISSIVTMSTPLPPTEVTAATENVVYYVDESELASISSVDNQTQKTIELNQIEKNLQLILNNQNNTTETIKVLIDNQKKLFHKLASLSIQIEDGFSTIQNKMSTNVVSLAKADSFEKETFEIKPIDSIRELEQMELLLSDKTEKNKLLKQFSFVCSSSEGNGSTCGYKVLDIFFSRDFLCKCSWTGGSRNSEDVKIGLKGYKNILNFFYELIRLWDKTYTVENNENFFKIVLKNSLKRKLSKNERASTKRRRTKKVAQENKGQAKDKSDQGKEVMNQNKTNEKHVIENDEMEKTALKNRNTQENQTMNQNKAETEKNVNDKDETKKITLKKKNLAKTKSNQVMNQIATNVKEKDVTENDKMEKHALKNKTNQEKQIMNQNKADNEKKLNEKDQIKKNILKKKNLPKNKSNQVTNQIATNDKEKDVIENGKMEKTALKNKNNQGNQNKNENKAENEKNVNNKEEQGASDADNEDEINEDEDSEKEHIENDEMKKTALKNKNNQGNQIMNQNKAENEKHVNKEEMGASDADDEDEINEDVDSEKEDGDIEEEEDFVTEPSLDVDGTDT